MTRLRLPASSRGLEVRGLKQPDGRRMSVVANRVSVGARNSKIQRSNEKIHLKRFGKFTSPVSISRLLFILLGGTPLPMPDIVIGFLIGCALGFSVGYGVREKVSRKRRRRYVERHGPA